MNFALPLVMCGLLSGSQMPGLGIGFQGNSQSPQREDSQPDDKRDPLQGESLEVRALVGLAIDAPPEFSADALLRIAKSSKISLTTRRELIENAFRVADKAQHPVQLGAKGRAVNGLPGYSTYAYALQLDSLSLRCRAVKAMLPLDKGRAREMFFSISLPELPPSSCQDSLVYDVSAFYVALTAVLNAAFTEIESARGDGVYLVERLIDQMVSPVQLLPIAKCIAQMKTSSTQLQMLIMTLAKRLRQMQADDRSFSYGINDLVSTGMGGLFNVCKNRGVQIDVLVEAFRSYLITQHRATRCADNVKDLLGMHPSLPRYLETFNTITRFLGTTEQKEIRPITLNEIAPKEVHTVPAFADFFESPKSSKLGAKMQQLGLSLKGTPLTAEEKAAQAWQDEVLEFLNELNDFQPDGEPDDLTYFHEKSLSFLNLLLIVPAGALYFRILDSYISFLSQSSSLTEDDRVQRIVYIDFLLNKIGRALRGEDSKKFTNAIGSAHDKVLRLYAALNDYGQNEAGGANRLP